MIARGSESIVRAPSRSPRVKKSPSDSYSQRSRSHSSRFAPTARANARYASGRKRDGNALPAAKPTNAEYVAPARARRLKAGLLDSTRLLGGVPTGHVKITHLNKQILPGAAPSYKRGSSAKGAAEL